MLFRSLYNKDLMETAPATTDELLELMKNETTADQYVFVEQHSTSYNAAAWIQGFGGYLINENREPGLNLPQTVEAMEYHKQFVSYMPADGEYNTVTTLFTEGKAASTIGGRECVNATEHGVILHIRLVGRERDGAAAREQTHKAGMAGACDQIGRAHV